MNFHWYINDDDWKNYPDKVKGAFDFDGCANTAGVVGYARVGELCFDLRAWGNRSENGLGYELFVGGVDSGYNETAKGYPYDLVDEYDEFPMGVLKLPLEEFKKLAEPVFEGFIQMAAHTYKRADLIAKANEPLHEW